MVMVVGVGMGMGTVMVTVWLSELRESKVSRMTQVSCLTNKTQEANTH